MVWQHLKMKRYPAWLTNCCGAWPDLRVYIGDHRIADPFCPMARVLIVWGPSTFYPRIAWSNSRQACAWLIMAIYRARASNYLLVNNFLWHYSNIPHFSSLKMIVLLEENETQCFPNSQVLLQSEYFSWIKMPINNSMQFSILLQENVDTKNYLLPNFQSCIPSTYCSFLRFAPPTPLSFFVSPWSSLLPTAWA